MGIWTREHTGQNLFRLIHHSDRGVQYRAVRYTQRFTEAGDVASVGSRGDSYDNALAEAFNSLFKAELIRNKGPWRSIDDLEIAVAEYIDWFNYRRLHGEIGMIPPVEVEQPTTIHTSPSEQPTGSSRASTEPGARQSRANRVFGSARALRHRIYAPIAAFSSA